MMNRKGIDGDDGAVRNTAGGDSDFLIAEYSALNDWRNNKVDYQATWGAILVPVASAIYGGGFLSSNGNGGILAISWIGSTLLLCFYRVVTLETDRGILKTAYPRMAEIEATCGPKGQFTRLFLKEAGWWSHKQQDTNWLPNRSDVEEVIRQYEGQTYLGKMFFPVTRGRLQGILSWGILIFILASLGLTWFAWLCPSVFFDIQKIRIVE